MRALGPYRWLVVVVSIVVILLALGFVIWRYRQATTPSPQPPFEVGSPPIQGPRQQPSPP